MEKIEPLNGQLSNKAKVKLKRTKTNVLYYLDDDFSKKKTTISNTYTHSFTEQNASITLEVTRIIHPSDVCIFIVCVILIYIYMKSLLLCLFVKRDTLDVKN